MTVYVCSDSVLGLVSLFYLYSYFYCFWLFFFFLKQKTAYEWRISDWSSYLCSSDLCGASSDTLEAMAITAADRSPSIIAAFTSSSLPRNRELVLWPAIRYQYQTT